MASRGRPRREIPPVLSALWWKRHYEYRRLVWGEKLTLREIAADMGCSPETVRRRLIEYGVPRRSPWRRPFTPFFGPRLSRDWVEEMRDAILAGLKSKAEVAAELCVSRTTVTHFTTGKTWRSPDEVEE